MIAVGVVLLILGLLFHLGLLWSLGILVLLIGLVLLVLGAAGHAVGGRTHYW